MPAFVLLAAGASSRMGESKALLPDHHGVPLARAWMDLARAAGLWPRLVVLGAEPEGILALLETGEQVAHNSDWSSTGPRESLGCAWPLIRASGSVIFTPVDVPPCTLGELQTLALAKGPRALSHSGALGHPAALPTTKDIFAFPTLRPLFAHAAAVPAGPDCLLNLNTPAQYQAWLKG